MPDGCKGKTANDRSCYPRKAVDDFFQDYREFHSIYRGKIVTKLEFNALMSKILDERPYTTGTKAEVLETYGPIEDWDMSQVTDLQYLFYRKETLNANLSNWDVSRVTTMARSKYRQF